MIEQATGPSRFFLGANSKNGFVSLYDNFTNPAAGDFMWVIKGSPGCGKSTFMKRLGAAAVAVGLRTEYILCSGDPDSLDAVYFPEKRLAYVDGTAPHVVEAKYPGAASLYLDLGRFLDADALAPKLSEIAALNRRYQALYADAYRQLSAGAALLPKNFPNLQAMDTQRKLEKKLDGLSARELRKLGKSGTQTRRFLSARSCQGTVFLTDTVAALCDRVWILDNELGLAHEFLSGLAGRAQKLGYDLILCPDPLEPEKTEALLLPEAGLAFLAADKNFSYPGKIYRHLRLDALLQLPSKEKTLLRQRRRESALLFAAAERSLAEAKALHDELEAVYRPHVDFNGLNGLVDAHIRKLLEK